MAVGWYPTASSSHQIKDSLREWQRSTIKSAGQPAIAQKHGTVASRADCKTGSQALLGDAHQSFYNNLQSIEHTQRDWRRILRLANDEQAVFMYQPFLNAPVGTREEKLKARETLCRIREGTSKCTRNLQEEWDIQEALVLLTVRAQNAWEGPEHAGKDDTFFRRLVEVRGTSDEKGRSKLEKMVAGEPGLKEALDRYLHEYTKTL
ncbi:hypothetical protein CPLU01_14137 [Colletotrichum plurivorum]|uniref:Uncharacterized protein n=1 Tax=Colletotrichum plurivorum TaxID=2175906 RepID=A0A8H6JMC8_9PEZI|nr:hypothetical protein CPLU01_14137 [Colletotrichum plurivorum]